MLFTSCQSGSYAIVIWAILVAVLVDRWDIHVDTLWPFLEGKVKPTQYLVHFVIGLCIVVIRYLVCWLCSLENNATTWPHGDSRRNVLKHGCDPDLYCMKKQG
jgi:hypothetical protein